MESGLLDQNVERFRHRLIEDPFVSPGEKRSRSKEGESRHGVEAIKPALLATAVRPLQSDGRPGIGLSTLFGNF